jgi:tetratricopeptide (TPR) repeat protein
MNDEPTIKRQQSKRPYISRLMPVGGIFVLLAILLPLLMDKKHEYRGLAGVEAPLAMKRFATGYASTDSVLNEALRDFSQKNYQEASRLFGRVHFFWAVDIREGRQKAYPEDLRFYLGLAEFYRGFPARGVPYLEEEEQANPYEAKYPWYLAHLYIAESRFGEARAELEKVIRIGGPFAPEAREKIQKLSARSQPAPGR